MIDLFRLSISDSGSLTIVANIFVALIIFGVIGMMALLIPWLRDYFYRQEFDVNELEIGVGAGKIKIKPNHDDLQIAYRLWVELRTRKLGLPFEEDHDVVSEVYNSWYEFFKITRELIKAIPIEKVRGRRSTQQLVGISIDVLNKGIRPHLTKWQARYRHWMEAELRKTGGGDGPPQELQKKFPKYQEMITDLKKTNAQLVAYADALAKILELDFDAVRE